MTIPDPTDCPYYLISRTALVVTSELRKDLAAAGAGQIRVSYLSVLMVLWCQDDLKSGELGRRAGLEPSTMTGLLDRMVRDALVVREPDPQDRRAQRICLTKEGREFRDPIMDAVNKTLGRVLDGIPQDDMNHVKETLRLVLSNSNKTSDP
ncbi:MAG: MarR family transcriptional regulator [Deltaproteobacteria bacterium]|nr:MarR family transcriptional regulator [Deltaproteobacteria bacterium]